MTTFSIRNLVKTTRAIQSKMTLPLILKASRDQELFWALKERLAADIRIAYDAVEERLQKKDRKPSDLAIRSRRAYQWLRYLDDETNLAAHLDALQRVNLFLPMIKRKKRFKNAGVDFSFYNQGSLYKLNGTSQMVNIVAQEALCLAPDRVLTAILETVLVNNASQAKDLIHEYTFSTAFNTAREELEYLGIEKGSLAAGEFFDLQKSFQRVNQSYFAGSLGEPHLIWSSRMTRRKFGHYQWDTDTVMVSKTLDQDNIPTFVLDYVMFHELLHKKLGAKIVNQRRAVHTTAFRKQESRYEKIEQSKRWLNRLSRRKK